MDLKKIGSNLIGKGLPLLGGVLGGSAGEKIGATIAGALGIDSEGLGRAIEDPAMLAELKKFEMEHKQELEKLQLEETRAYLADVQSARSREVEMAKATGERDLNMYVLAWVIVVGFFGLLGLLFFTGVPETGRDLLNLSVGSLLAGFSTVVGYFFGSSAGSKAKNSILNKNSGKG
jgi:hypothetical protein